MLEFARDLNIKANKLVILPIQIIFNPETTRFHAVFYCCIKYCFELNFSDLRAVASLNVFTVLMRKYDKYNKKIAKLID